MSSSNNFSNFTEFIDDFSDNNKYNEAFVATFGVTPEECSKLTFNESLDVSLDSYTKSLNETAGIENIIDSKLGKLNLCEEMEYNFIKRVSTMPPEQMLKIAIEMNNIVSSKVTYPLKEFDDTLEKLKEKGFKNFDIYCPICKTTHWVNDCQLDEPTLLNHLEITFKSFGNHFINKSGRAEKTKKYIRARFDVLTEKMHVLFQKFIEVRRMDFNLMKVLYASYKSSVTFLSEFSLTLLNVLKKIDHKDTHKMLLIGKTIHELLKGPDHGFFMSTFRTIFMYLRKQIQCGLFNFFEEMYEKLSDTNLCMNCLLIGLKYGDIDEMITATDRMFDELESTKSILLDGYFEVMEAIISSLLLDKYNKLFELMEKEFHDNFKTQFLKLFTEDAYEKYKNENEPTNEEQTVFSIGKQTENIIKLCMNSLKKIVSDLVEKYDSKTSLDANFPSDLFKRTGNKFWHDYDYTEEDDPYVRRFIDQSEQVKRDLLGRLASDFDVEPVIIPTEFVERLSKYRTWKTDEDWLNNYVPIDVQDTYRALYFYFLNRPKLTKKMIVTSNKPELNRLSENELDTIKKIFSLTTEELNKFIDCLTRSEKIPQQIDDDDDLSDVDLDPEQLEELRKILSMK